ncbi:hypothetical protein Bbelb_357620 [Branchiostoma belcheri]|nr:hypothetical protein Bbelb_357620 [Branchiostoma belcheri]
MRDLVPAGLNAPNIGPEPNALPLRYRCATAALPLRYRCATAALPLRYRCATAALPLRYRCATAALPLRYRCATAAPHSIIQWVKARFWIRADNPEPYLSMVLDKARFYIQQKVSIAVHREMLSLSVR